MAGRLCLPAAGRDFVILDPELVEGEESLEILHRACPGRIEGRRTQDDNRRLSIAAPQLRGSLSSQVAHKIVESASF